MVSLTVLLLVQSSLALGIGVTVPLSAPSGSPLLSQSLVSFSIEQDRWTDWVGTTSRNQFFFNVLNNLNILSSVPPRIRIGANSEDHTNYNPALQFAQDIFPASTTTVPYPEASNITVGDSYYATAQFLPPNTHVVWGVNFGQNNLTAAFLEAKAIVKAFDSDTVKNAGIVLDAIEIGNEADLYLNNGFRPRNYSVPTYVTEWSDFAANVSAAAGVSASSQTRFWGCAFAGSSHSATSGFSPQFAINQGLLNSPAGAAISTISQHHYSGSFCSGNEGLLQDLMTKSTIRSNLSAFSTDITAVRARGLDYVFGETNSYSCHGAPGVSNTAGAALWTLDYVLFASQIGISRVYFHEGIGFKYNLIQPATLTRSTLDGSNLPSPLPPHVQPQYYAAVVAAEAIGPKGGTHAVELSINNTRISGYAFYEGTTFARAVFINSEAFLTTTTGARTTVHLDFTLNGTPAPNTMTIKRLTINHADDTSGLTWGGQTYETADGTISGNLQVATANVSSGLDIQATEVVMVTFH